MKSIYKYLFHEYSIRLLPPSGTDRHQTLFATTKYETLKNFAKKRNTIWNELNFVPIHRRSKRIKEMKRFNIPTAFLQNSVIYSFQNIENFMKDVYKDRYGEDISDDSVKKLYSVAVSIFAIGGMLGGFSGGIIANRFGRFVPIHTVAISFRTCNLALGRSTRAQAYLSILKIRIARKRVCMYNMYVAIR